MLESELGLLWLRAGKMAEAKGVVESGKTAVEELQVSTTWVQLERMALRYLVLRLGCAPRFGSEDA